MLPLKIETITIGDELLNGIRVNGHLAYFGEVFGRYGLALERNQEVRDREDEIRRAFRDAWERSDIVITTGGLGPTSDDLTREAIAAELGRELVFDAGLEATLNAYFAARGRTPTANNLRQCMRIDGAEALPNPNGTAPGLWLEDGDRILILLPGPAGEMHPMLSDVVLPRLECMGRIAPRAGFLQLRTSGMGESEVAMLLTPLFEPFGARLEVGYCAHQGVVDVRLGAAAPVRAPAGAAAEPALDALAIQELGKRCAEALGEAFVGFGAPELACVIMRRLRCLGKTLAVAESCTGGLLASHFTDVPGASKVFMGGIVCYRNEAKENLLGIPDSLLVQHGAVSNECAIAMATAVAELLEADYALSITGFAGPEGGSEPAGTVYIGYHSPVGVWSRKVVLPGNRAAVKQRAVHIALDFIRRKLRRYEAHDLLESLKC